MQDPWKYLGFPAAAIGGYVFAQTQAVIFLQNSLSIGEYMAELAVVAVAGFIAGFLVDEVIPAYLSHVRRRGSQTEMNNDFGGGEMDEDFNLN
mgnify:CR=1 FL=1